MYQINHYNKIQSIYSEILDEKNTNLPIEEKIILKTPLYHLFYWNEIPGKSGGKKQQVLTHQQINDQFIMYKPIKREPYKDIFYIKDQKKNCYFQINKFYNKEIYIHQKKIIQKLIQIEEIKKLNTSIIDNISKEQPHFLVDFDDKSNTFIESAPIFTLQDIIDIIQQAQDENYQDLNQLQFQDEEVVLLFAEILNKIWHLANENIFHASILPENIAFYFEDNQTKLKFINYQHSVDLTESKQQKQKNDNYYMNRLSTSQDGTNNQEICFPSVEEIDESLQPVYPRTISKFYVCKDLREKNNILFNDNENCQKAEIYSAARCIWKLICGSNLVLFRDLNNLKQNLINSELKPNFQKIFMILKLIFLEPESLNFEIQQVNEFLSEITQNYPKNFNDLLSNKLKNLKTFYKQKNNQKKTQSPPNPPQKLHFFSTFKLHQNLIQTLEQHPDALPPEAPYLIQKAAKISRKINSENSQKQFSSSLYQSLSLLSTMLTKAQLETDKKIKLGLFEQIHEFFDLDKKKRKNLNQNQNQNLSNLNILVDIPKEFYFLEFGKFLIQIGSKKQGVLNILKCLKKKIKKFQISHPQTLKIVDILTTVNENFSQFYKNQEYILQSILIKQKQMNDSNELLIQSYKNLGLYWWSKGCNRLFSQYQENALESYEQGINIIEQKQKFKIQMLELIHKIFYILALQQNYKDLNEYIEEIDSNIVYLFGQQSLEYTQYQIKKSEILILQERWDEALKIVKEIQNNNKNNYYIYSISKIKEAVIYSENNYTYKNYAEAHKCLTKALKLSEDNNNVQLMKEIYLKFSHFYQNKDNQKDLNYETAVDYIQKNIEISQTLEEQADRKFDLSKIYIEQQQYDQAQSLLKEVCEVYYQIYQDNHWKFEQVFDILAEILLELELYQPSLKKADQSLKLKIKNHGYHSIQVVEQYMNNANLQIKYIEKIKDQQNPSQIKLNPIVTNFDNPSLFSTSDKNKFSPTQASSPLQFSLVRTKEPNFDFSELRKTSNPNFTFNNNNNINNINNNNNNNNINRSRTRLNSCETSNISNLKLQYLEKSTMSQKNQNICKILNQANNELLQGWNILFKLTNLDPKIKHQEINQILDIQKKLYQLENQLLVVNNNNEHSNQKHQKCLTDLVSGEEVPVLPISQNPSVNRSRAKSKVFQNQGNDSTCIIF